MHVFADYHTHTKYSHGKGSVEDNVVAAVSKGLECIAISDHGPSNLFGVGVRSLETFKSIKSDICALRQRFPKMQIMLGVEANIISPDGKLDIPQTHQKNFDIVQAGLHLMVRPASLVTGLTLIANLAVQSFPGLRRALRDTNTQMTINAVLRNDIDVITHPGLRVDIDTVALAEVCAKRGTALEINTSHHHTTVEYIRAAAQTGVDFVIGSDAHHPSRVGDFEKGIALAEAAGVKTSKIRNAR